MGERWQVSGTAAENYTRFVATWFAPWAADLVERAGIQPGSSVLDIACGTGVVTRAASRLIGPEGYVVGSDLNEEMLAEAGMHPLEGAPVEWRQADATDLPFPPQSFDTVLCHQGLQFVPDKAAAASEMRRVLRPSGRAAVGIWGSLECNPYGTALSGGLRRHLSEEAGLSMSAPFGFGNRGEVEQLFRDSGFSEVEVTLVELVREPVPARPAIEGNLAALPIAEQIAGMSAKAYAGLIDDIVGELSPFISDGLLVVPASSHVVIATR